MRITGELHERYLRHVWTDPALTHRPLTTTDGQIVVILDHGCLNLRSGPDFLDARLRIGDLHLRGDIEFHRSSSDWFRHHHNANPRYNEVILHVVFRPEGAAAVPSRSGRRIPTLVLSSSFVEPYEAIARRAVLGERGRCAQTIPCAESNYDLPGELLDGWLLRLSRERRELKCRRFEDRLRSIIHERTLSSEELDPGHSRAWEQVVYEGLMDGLGYARNRLPFMRLARNVSLDVAKRLGLPDTPLLLEALLFGAAGLIPEEHAIPEQVSRRHAAQLRDAWNALRNRYRGETLTEADWSFSPTRPANFPTVRLSVAPGFMYALLRRDLLARLISDVRSQANPRMAIRTVARLCDVTPHEFWFTHVTFDHVRTRLQHPLGDERITAMITNVVVPFSALYARLYHDDVLLERTDALMRNLPASGANAVTRLIDGHLIRGKFALKSAQREQGAIQLYGFYCSRERCAECEVGRELGLR